MAVDTAAFDCAGKDVAVKIKKKARMIILRMNPFSVPASTLLRWGLKLGDGGSGQGPAEAHGVDCG